MKKILNSKYGLLIFSIMSGLGYFILIMFLLSNINYSYLLGIFFFPAIICGVALCIYKTVTSLAENNEYGKINRIFIIHSALIVFAAICAVTAILL